jgi:inner membrane protein
LPEWLRLERSTASILPAMDPLTQGLLGAAAAQAVFTRRLGSRSLLVGGVAGMLPDLDVLIRSASDPLLTVEYHRQFTHSLLFIPAGGALAALPWLLSPARRSEWKSVVGASVVGWATHGLLDACTSFGTQLFWPFARTRVAFHVISVIDPLFTLVLLAGVVAAVLRRSPRPAAIALAVGLLVLTIGAVQRDRAADAQQQLAAARGQTIERGEVFPTAGNNLVWRSLYRSGDRLYSDRLRVGWTSPAQFAPGFTMNALAERDLVPAERSSARFRNDVERLRWFAGGWLARDSADPGIIGDARYSRQTVKYDAVWGIRFRPEQTPVTGWVDRSRSRRVDPGDVWREIRGRDPRYRVIP